MEENVKKIYEIMLGSYGRQGWWPVTDIGGKIPTYSFRERLSSKQKTEIIFGSILTQNTAWENAEKAIIELNCRDMIDINKILEKQQHELALLIKSSGYYNQKALKLKAICYFIKQNPLHELDKMDILKLRALLLSIKGVGPETADSIILYALNKPVFVIDAYTKRIFARIGICKMDISYDNLQSMFHLSLPHDARLFNEYHALLVEHAKRYCRKKPLCAGCILDFCCRKLKVS